MIVVFIKPNTLYRFPTLKTAEIWMAENAYEYGYDKSSLQIFTDKQPNETIELQGSLFIRSCPNCEKLIKFEVMPEDYIEDVICSNCSFHLGPQ